MGEPGHPVEPGSNRQNWKSALFKVLFLRQMYFATKFEVEVDATIVMEEEKEQDKLYYLFWIYTTAFLSRKSPVLCYITT